MRKLNNQYSRRGFNYDVLQREQDIVLSTQTLKNSDRVIGYEVFKVQSHNGRIAPNGIFVDPAEFPPSDEQWGRLGWSFYAKEKAIKKFNQLVASNITKF